MKSVNVLFVLVSSAFLLSSCVASNKDIDAIYSRLSNNEKQIRDINSQLDISADGVVPGQAEMWAQMQAMRQDLNQVVGQMSDWNLQNAEGENFTQLRAKVARIEAAVRKMGSVLAIELDELDAALPPPGGFGLNQFGGAVYGGAAGIDAAPGGTPGAVAIGLIPSGLVGAEEAGAAGEGVTVAAGAAGVTSGPVEAQPMSRDSSEVANTLYNSGTKAFSDRRYNDAVKIFQDFVATYPDNKLTSNAYFWQGESNYQLKDYSRAIVAYQQVIEKYPGSDKLQSSMFKQGVSMYQRGQKEAGKVRLNELIGKYPKSQEAERARNFLKGK
ncbi:MAG: tol-pal system protein YbgF [Deltaproteobacteria bacterium]|jgi:tol-pal system protein YbgF|nr:tol-pal system protein YbgF [Deltaproteobacteria bacterium]